MGLNWATARDSEVVDYAKKAGWQVESARIARQVGGWLDQPNSANFERELLEQAREIESEDKSLVDQWIWTDAARLKDVRANVRTGVDGSFDKASRIDAALRSGRLSPSEAAKAIAEVKAEVEAAEVLVESIEEQSRRLEQMKENPFEYLDHIHRAYGLEDRRRNLA